MGNHSIDFHDALTYHEWVRTEGKDVEIVSVAVVPYNKGVTGDKPSINVILVTYRD
ncbi:MAG: hypothetical protein QOG31_1914 [Thermoplasmata archaeon]|jgi:hypothetical protein|nr:hypothetical protein [Thermoplasmata archaeon]